MSSSILYNPSQVINNKMIRELSKELDVISLKPFSRAESFQRHASGGSVNFMNYRLREVRSKRYWEDCSKQRELDREKQQERSRNVRLPSIDQSTEEFFKEKIKTLEDEEPQLEDNYYDKQGEMAINESEHDVSSRFIRPLPPHKNKRSKVLHFNALQSLPSQQFQKQSIQQAVYLKRNLLTEKYLKQKQLPSIRASIASSSCEDQSSGNNRAYNNRFTSQRPPLNPKTSIGGLGGGQEQRETYINLKSKSIIDLSVSNSSNIPKDNFKVHPQTRKFIKRISKDNTLQKNRSNLRLSYNPLLDDLLEAQEREAYVRAEADFAKKQKGQSQLEKVKESYSMQKIRNRSSHVEEKAHELIKSASMAYVSYSPTNSKSTILPSMAVGQ